MMEYTTTLHVYEAVTPPRCKLARLEPAKMEAVLNLHYAESAPVAMRVVRPLAYTSREDGTRKIYSDETIELLALDGILWKPYRTGWDPYRPGEWTADELARLCVDEVGANIMDRWPWQWRDDDDPPRGMLVRDRGTYYTPDEVSARLARMCTRYAAIGGNLYEPAREFAYIWTVVHARGNAWKHDGYVIAAKEYDPKRCDDYMCNALQDWHEVNPFGDHASGLIDDVSGADVIEVLMPEYVTADPHADYLQKKIGRAHEKADRLKADAKDAEAKAKRLRDEAKRDRAAAARELEDADTIADELASYLASKEA